MHLLYLLSADAGNLHAVCCSLAEAMLNLTDSLLRSRIHQQEQQRERMGNCYYMGDQDYICLDETGHLLRPDYVTCKFSQLVKKRGLKKITFHGLRHSCASMLYERGQDMKKIQEWLGHSTPVTTETIYAHLNVKHKDETAWIANDCLPLELPEKMREKTIQTA